MCGRLLRFAFSAPALLARNGAAEVVADPAGDSGAVGTHEQRPGSRRQLGPGQANVAANRLRCPDTKMYRPPASRNQRGGQASPSRISYFPDHVSRGVRASPNA